MVYLFASQPVSESHCIAHCIAHCIVYCLVARNCNFEQPESVMQEIERTIFA